MVNKNNVFSMFHFSPDGLLTYKQAMPTMCPA